MIYDEIREEFQRIASEMLPFAVETAIEFLPDDRYATFWIINQNTYHTVQKSMRFEHTTADLTRVVSILKRECKS